MGRWFGCTDPPVFEANMSLSWRQMPSRAAWPGGFVTQLCTCCAGRAPTNGQPLGEMPVSPHRDVWVMLGDRS